MKKLIGFCLIAILSLSVVSCGDDYYEQSVIGEVYEFTGDLGWTEGLGYNMYYEFPYGLYPSDGLAVYILWQVDGGLDVWRPLPETTYTLNGPMTYSYDYTQYDMTVYLKTDFDPSYLVSGDLLGQTFRAVTIPADFTYAKSANAMDYDTLIKALEDAGFEYQVIEGETKITK